MSSHPGLYQQKLKTLREYDRDEFDRKVAQYFTDGWEIHTLHTVSGLHGVEHVAYMMHHGMG